MLKIEIGIPLAFEGGDEKALLCIDRFIDVGEVYLISGWIYDSEVRSCSGDGVADCAAVRRHFSRDDVANGFGFPPERVKGFLLLASAPGSVGYHLELATVHETRQVNLLTADAKAISEEIINDLFRDYNTYAGLLHQYLRDFDGWRRILGRAAPNLLQQATAKGHIELARGISDIGGLIVGWSISPRSSDVFLLSESGELSELSGASRWNRADIVESFANQFGNLCQFAGFITSQQKPLRYGEKIYLLCVEGDQIHQLAAATWEAAPKDPLSFARWSFDYPTPMSTFYDRLERHDGPILKKLISQQKSDTDSQSFEAIYYGTTLSSPICTIVIPLFRRFDFIRNQLLEMSADPYIRKNCEIIYVLDDPLLGDALRGAAPIYYNSYQVAFRVIYSDVNRGFAGATNLGTTLANAPIILLLNSDVIPTEPGWLEAMIEELDGDKKVGAVGSRLLFANGAVQHDGMNFEWEPSWRCHLNKHPNAGMDPLSLMKPLVTEERAVTAACMLLYLDQYRAVGGLDDQFLIGDFEDSDLCLKLAELGLSIKCIHDNKLTHLERQSFSSLGTSSFRDKVARFNAWRHEQRWGESIRLTSHRVRSAQ